MILFEKTGRTIRFSFILALACFTSCTNQNPGNEIIPFGHNEIDMIRSELAAIPTNALYIWSRFLMFSGADMTLDPADHEGHYHIVQPRYPNPGTITEMNYSLEFAEELDYQWGVLEQVYARFLESEDSLEMELRRDPSENKGEVRNWPSMRGECT